MTSALPSFIASIHRGLHRMVTLFALSLLAGFYPASVQAQVQRSIANGSFESPSIATGCQGYVYAARVLGWFTTDAPLTSPTADFDAPNGCVGNNGTNPSGGTRVFEFYSNGVIDNQSRLKLNAAQGSQFVELNAQTASRLYQNVCLVTNETVGFSFSHLGRRSSTVQDVARFMVGGSTTLGSGTEVVRFGDTSANSGAATAGLSTNTVRSTGASAGASGRNWGRYAGSFVVPSSLGGMQPFAFEAVSSSSGSTSQGNFFDDFVVTLKPIIEFNSATYTSIESNSSAPAIQFRVAGVVPTGGVPVSLTVASTSATLGSDFTINGGSNANFTFTIPAGDYGTGTLVSAGVPVSIVDDATPESTETFSVRINASANYVISSTSACNGTAKTTSTYTITDDDVQITLQKRWMNAIPNNAVNLTISGGNGATSATSQAGTANEYAVAATATAISGAQITLSESFTTGSAGYYSTNIACTASDGSTVTPSGSGLSRTITMPAASVTCTFTNTGPTPPSVTPQPLTGVKTCPAANPMSTNRTLQAGWNHNWPPNNSDADEGVKTDFVTYSQVLPGPGITYIPANTAGVARLVDTQTAAAAFGAGDYVDYRITTGTAPADRALFKIRYGVNNEQQWVNGYPFTFTVLASTDPTFATARTLILDQKTPFDVSGVYRPYEVEVPAAARFLLQNNTTYYFRVLLYKTEASPTDYDTAIWDDFAIFTADCLKQSVQLNKSWTGGTNGHKVDVTTTGAINTNPTLSSVAPTNTVGTPVNVYQGETLTLPAETYSGGATAALYATTVACTGGSPLASGAVGRTVTIQGNATATICTYTNSFVGPLTVTKTSAPYWDPVNLTTNPKMIPGAYANYTITVASPAISVTSNTVIVTDALPPQVNLCVTAVGQCSAPINFTPGSSGLTYTYSGASSTTDDVEFSTDNVNWTYSPVAGADGTDPAVRFVRINPKGSMNPNSNFSFALRTLIK